ncbi:Protein LUTEIN DEFICIENT 5, chloroplastic [Talaromyces islandicus]|uniref:Protein LUTEIN DEFICIENT 5, chloroplastic n=1 Tax=Talaromyces islandicus TaxID=28573 RepID=A0A0U1LTT5_TALIS|nr:Protein LUTEIN DEFICIENT 5, chloroplastic [Talaromyces islandicus]
MPQPRTIKDYFKRPSFVTTPKEALREKESFSSSFPAASQPSSPLSDPPSDLPSQLLSSQQLPDEERPRATARSSVPVSSHHTSDATLQPASSFNSSQRIVKNGMEIVVDSDAESGESLDSSLESAEELLNRFLGSSSKHTKDSESPAPDSTSQPWSRASKFRYSQSRPVLNLKAKNYKFSMASLVTRSVDDSEAEAGVAKAKAQLQNEEHKNRSSPGGPDGNSGIHEDVLASAFAAEKEESELQRLLDAVRRTEALEVEKSWSFFGNGYNIQSPEFPRNSILPSARESFLRDPAPRERAFHSGILDFALARGLLPDEVILWVLQSVPLEPRDDLRYAYCRALKHVGGQRIESLIQPCDIELVFGSLGGTQTALNTSAEIVPQNSYNPEESPAEWKYLSSVLDLLRDISDRLHEDTRQHTLKLLLRLALDIYVTKHSTACSALETTIDSLLQSIPQGRFNELVQPLAKSTFQMIKDVTLQSQLLKHILPTNADIALFRARLALSFLTNDESILSEPAADVFNLKRITQHLRSAHFGSKLHQAKSSNNYDYSELKATTSLLNIVIDVDRAPTEFPSKEAESQFNNDVDALADRVKRIFSAIEDSGASHLKRTEAKQSLEALHYRIVFSIRSKPRVRSVFGIDDSQQTIQQSMAKRTAKS